MNKLLLLQLAAPLSARISCALTFQACRCPCLQEREEQRCIARMLQVHRRTRARISDTQPTLVTGRFASPTQVITGATIVSVITLFWPSKLLEVR